jgi:hypothetical protein
MFELPIICCNGIGDSLLVVGRVPIRILGSLGFRFNLFYESSEHSAKKILVPFFRKIKYVRYVERSPSKSERVLFQKMMSLSGRIRTIWAVPHSETRDKPSVRWAQADGKQTRRVAIQTHLDGHHGWKGATAKIWKIENWIAVIKELHDMECEVAIMEWDAIAMAKIKQECPYIKDVSSGSLWELCGRINGYDCIVSVDSWVKYAVAWNKSPQVILVPDLRKGYTPDFAGISAQWVAKWWFHGLLDKPKVRIIGLEKSSGQFEFTLAKLEDLKPKNLLKEIKLLLGKTQES